ncbi:MAG: hypothetical protein IPP61_02825 [Cytophagaceae bacterium]|nr:hypothetical protein [Cytophagaceae bacterium]MBL0324106.1 hypothetical protein [Cytophagaceae bacterium]
MPRLDTTISFIRTIEGNFGISLPNYSEFVKLIPLPLTKYKFALVKARARYEISRISKFKFQPEYLELTIHYDYLNNSKIQSIDYAITDSTGKLGAYYLPLVDFWSMASYWGGNPRRNANYLAVFVDNSYTTPKSIPKSIILVKCELNGDPSSFTLDQLTFPMGGGGPDPNHTGTRLP